ncbi:MAG: PucR family transcriptional regulator [Solirubrobacteraceae bacterium]
MAPATPRATPLTIISAAVAGDDLQSVAAAAAEGLGCPVAVVLPALGTLIVWPTTAADRAAAHQLLDYASAVIAGREPANPETVADAVAIRIGREIVGIVAALGEHESREDSRNWLEAAAAAAAVAALIRENQDGDADATRRAVLQALSLARPADTPAFIAQCQRLGFDLTSGAIAICAEFVDGGNRQLPPVASALLAEVSDGRVLGLLPLSAAGQDPGLDHLYAALDGAGLRVAASLPHRDPATLHEALREAEVMLGLADEPDAMLATQEDTFRLLIRVLLRDPGELEQLRTRTISSLERYDSEHDTELLATLRAFLAHHGSTTETAEAMRLHRHTVGYRLTRVQEVSGLSPYESDGRERLSLGLKAHRILEADARRPRRGV